MAERAGGNWSPLVEATVRRCEQRLAVDPDGPMAVPTDEIEKVLEDLAPRHGTELGLLAGAQAMQAAVERMRDGVDPLMVIASMSVKMLVFGWELAQE